MFKKLKNFFSSVKEKLTESSTSIKQTVSVVLGGKIEIDEDSYEKITDALILSDISITTSEKLIKKIKKRLQAEKFNSDPSEEFFLRSLNEVLIANAASAYVLKSVYFIHIYPSTPHCFPQLFTTKNEPPLT